jgi:hypothetical protein
MLEVFLRTAQKREARMGEWDGCQNIFGGAAMIHYFQIVGYPMI